MKSLVVGIYVILDLPGVQQEYLIPCKLIDDFIYIWRVFLYGDLNIYLA